MNFTEFKRRNERRTYRTDVSFVHKNQSYRGTIKDLSLGGAFVVTTWVNHFSPGDMILINIPFTTGKKTVQRKASVKWLNNEGFGIEFI